MCRVRGGGDEEGDGTYAGEVGWGIAKKGRGSSGGVGMELVGFGLGELRGEVRIVPVGESSGMVEWRDRMWCWV